MVPKIEDIIIKILSDNGINIFESEMDEKLIIDSIQFVSIVVSLEESFNITIPGEYLSFERLQTVADFEEVIRTLVKGGEKYEEEIDQTY
ncbi:acyl carrier protein [Paenibacillus phocaensis]|uniref:acyl carrier protein n=1 Tax=Paenibacillus phocaensis TaxID=1776378 RepID=UPI00039C49FF|nr:acyl carrier protein [Paenibacillus phocaensis]